jgi:hypothetical protein
MVLTHAGGKMEILSKFFEGAHAHIASATGAIVGAYVLWVISQTTKFIRSYRRRNTVAYQINKALKIQDLLSHARGEWHADRVYVFQFSNGTYYANNTSQLNMTCTHQSVGAGVAPVVPEKTEYLVTQYPELFTDLMHKKCWQKNTRDVELPPMKAVLEGRGVQSFLMHAFYCEKNPTKIEGFVGVEYMHIAAEDVAEHVCPDLQNFAVRVGEELRS